MSDELRNLPQWNLLHRLRERWGVSQEFCSEIQRRLGEGRHYRVMYENLAERVAYLEEHVPPEIANPPPPPEPYRPHRRND